MGNLKNFLQKNEKVLKLSHRLADYNIRVYKTGKTINAYCRYLILIPKINFTVFRDGNQKPLYWRLLCSVLDIQTRFA